MSFNFYAMTGEPEAVVRLFRVSHNRAPLIDPKSAIFPGSVAPIVRKAEDGERELVNLNWGFMSLQTGCAPRRVTDVRADRILRSPVWFPSFQQRRCLVPASSYCEPKGVKPTVYHWFALKGEEDRPLFAFPGVWTHYRGPLKKEGGTVDQEVFAFLSTEPNDLTRNINSERMPVLMSDPADFETWLSGPTEEAFQLARSYAANQMRIVKVGGDRQDRLA